LFETDLHIEGDKDFQTVFNKIDSSKSGTIDQAEVKTTTNKQQKKRKVTPVSNLHIKIQRICCLCVLIVRFQTSFSKQ
jgi:hypothetical protein